MLPLRLYDNPPHSLEAVSSKGIELVPFIKNGINTYNKSDSYLAQVYRRIVREKTVHKVFYDGSIQNTNDFIHFFKSQNHEVFFVNFKGEEVGFFWLAPFMPKSTFLNYCFYKDYWGEKSLMISKWIIDNILKLKNEYGEHVFDTILGVTPESNRLAIKFQKEIGLTILGKIPGLINDLRKEKTVAGVFSYISRQGNGKKYSIIGLNFLFS